MVQLSQNATFTKDWLSLILTNKAVFPQNFDSVETPSVFLTRQVHPAEATSAHDPHLLEVINRHSLRLASRWLLPIELYTQNWLVITIELTCEVSDENCAISQDRQVSLVLIEPRVDAFSRILGLQGNDVAAFLFRSSNSGLFIVPLISLNMFKRD